MQLGTQYYRPPFPNQQYWEDDLRAMADAGLNTAQFWVLFGLSPGGCTDHPEVWSRMQEFFRAVVGRYKDAPNLFGWLAIRTSTTPAPMS